jgi:flavin-dependent dehydrogenase
MKRIAILGGGPAGSFAGHRLASAGFDVTIFDEKPAWEKPCGGGLTFKAYSRYPFLAENAAPKRRVTEAILDTPRAAPVRLTLRNPLLIYSRSELNGMLLERAAAAGARVERARVSEMERGGESWRLRTSAGVAEADFCIVATGARNSLAGTRMPFAAGEAVPALGYFVPGDQAHVDLVFLPNMGGYIWMFPRHDHVSAGISAKGVPAARLRMTLEAYLTVRGVEWQGAPFYAHVLPALKASSWPNLRPTGDGWLVVGDAAGLVDPVTGEGIYYALLSAELACDALLESGLTSAAAKRYQETLWTDIAADLQCAARMADWFYHGSFLRGSIPSRMAQFAHRSRSVAAVVQDLFAGTQPYATLKKRLIRTIPAALLEMAFGGGAA